MKKYKYEKYDYAFIYGLLTEAQKKSLQAVLDQFIGYPNTESSRVAVKVAVKRWMFENNININDNLKIDYE